MQYVIYTHLVHELSFCA